MALWILTLMSLVFLLVIAGLLIRAHQRKDPAPPLVRAPRPRIEMGDVAEDEPLEYLEQLRQAYLTRRSEERRQVLLHASGHVLGGVILYLLAVVGGVVKASPLAAAVAFAYLGISGGLLYLDARAHVSKEAWLTMKAKGGILDPEDRPVVLLGLGVTGLMIVLLLKLTTWT